ncbi:DUF6343 family protein [Streptomyces sp. HUAS 31]|uniref:Uncharacterized protein n=3 Tax=Streptomyces TaxID=1883 RepID=A0A7H8TFX0_STRCX|nr:MULTISPECIES: DUF6343 family protein [Streptomyces]MBT1096987.1 hypothetical protein [Streptomyces sp. Tu102]QEV70877.1 hypothetical protein CP983_32455 [Streptomyces chartreusis]QKZ22295.1 hypothetical protein HUT05_36035 [Streptomyces chartreusis]WCD96134.1 DUF6343 family protein [Streptomyces sp. HUAS 31]WSZ70400.1 DUF6343 family protein [Streptomyces chartreusis]
MRTGSEPTTARSALRVRFWLCVWGVLWAIFGTAAFALAGRPGWAAACGVLWLVITIDMTMILRHIRQGPHYQPGRDVPPYLPPEDRPYRPPRQPPGTPPAPPTQRHPDRPPP